MRKELNEFIALVRRAGEDPKDRALFKDVVDRALALSVVTPREVADTLECAPSTVDRWRSGVAAPHPAICALMYTWLIAKAERQPNPN